jgi:hypothetical protein
MYGNSRNEEEFEEFLQFIGKEIKLENFQG